MLKNHSKSKKSITLRDVAQHAGVSPKTVSNVINDWPYITDGTRQKVQDAIKELGYRPSLLASSLRSGRTKAIGVTIADITNPFYGQWIHGVEEVLSSAGYNIFLANTNDDLEKEIRFLEMVVRWGVDGLLLSGSRVSTESLSEIVDKMVPIIAENSVAECENMTVIKVDHITGGSLAVRHLIERGCKRIAHVGGPTQHYAPDLRFAGYQEALTAAGYPIDLTLVQRIHASIRNGYQASMHLLTEKKPDGMFCYNDLIAIGTLIACRQLRLRVPEDVAIVGFDDIPMAALIEPGLTTIRVNQVEMGRMAGRLMLDRLARNDTKLEYVTVPVELVVRRSTDPNARSSFEGEDIDHMLQTDLAGLDPQVFPLG